MNKNTGLTPAAINAFMSGDIENFIVAATPGGIEAQEKRGQMALAEKQQLPRQFSGCTKEEFIALGFKFSNEPADDLFWNVEMPKGWKIVPTDHSMWSDLVDDKGRRRGGIFYKAAFYDRSANVSLCRRYRVECYLDGDTPDTLKTVVKDCDNTIHTIGDRPRSDYKAADRDQKKAEKWLKKNFPNYEDHLKYWD